MNEIKRADQKDLLNDIFENEAKALLGDIAISTSLSPLALTIDENQSKKAVEYIVSVFQQCHQLGHLTVAISEQEQTVLGYAMLFLHPEYQCAYLHKINVFEEFRGCGVGVKMLSSLNESFGDLGLICSHDKIKFYESNGFKCVGDFKVPDNDNFKMSKHMYTGLYSMSNSQKVDGFPVFFLNDADLRIIGGIS